MKILVTLEIEVDESEWAAANGVTKARVPRDVTIYVLNEVQTAPLIQDVAGEVVLAD